MLGSERRFYGYGPACGDGRSDIAPECGPVGRWRRCWQIEHRTASSVGLRVDDRLSAHRSSRLIRSELGPTRSRGAAECWILILPLLWRRPAASTLPLPARVRTRSARQGEPCQAGLVIRDDWLMNLTTRRCLPGRLCAAVSCHPGRLDGAAMPGEPPGPRKNLRGPP